MRSARVSCRPPAPCRRSRSTSTSTAEHRAGAARGTTCRREDPQQLRLAQTQVLAPDNGVISARSATVGAVLPAGQELFRLIRGGRLEGAPRCRRPICSSRPACRPASRRPAAAPSSARSAWSPPRSIRPRATASSMSTCRSPVRRVPACSRVASSRSAARRACRCRRAPWCCATASSYVLRVGPDAKVTQTKVTVGRRWADRIEITGGLDKSGSRCTPPAAASSATATPCAWSRRLAAVPAQKTASK